VVDLGDLHSRRALVLALLPTLDVGALRRELASPAGGLPVLLWVLAVTGMLWAAVPWGERFGDLDSFHRLLAIPLLLAQFRNSSRGMLSSLRDLPSCTMSWAFALIGVTIPGKSPGVPVKEYIFQTGIFLVCAFALLGAAFDFWRTRKHWIAVALCALLCRYRLYRGEPHSAPCCAAARDRSRLPAVWPQGRSRRRRDCRRAHRCAVLESPYLRTRIVDSMADLRRYLDANAATSTGEHLEFL